MIIYVYKQNQYLGKLEENNDRITFIYSEDIDEKYYIDTIKDKKNTFEDLPLVFKNLLLENEDLTKKTSTKIEKLLLLSDIHGSYQFSQTKHISKKKNKIYNYQDVKEEILDSGYPFPNILDYKLDIPKEKLEANNQNNVIGLSGFQHKFSVTKDDKTKTITTSENDSNYFMKPYNKHHLIFQNESYIPCLLINEHLFMTIARDLGFDIPYNAIIKGEKDYHYIIKRFDRFDKIKFDHEEFATMLGYDSNSKYNTTILEIMTKAQAYLPSNELKELLSFIFYSVVISHGDLHSKNLSLIHQSNAFNEQKKCVSPYYDISTSFIYKGLKNRDIGMKVFNKKKGIKKQDFLNLAQKFEIDNFEDEIERICRYFIDNFKSYINSLPNNIQNIPIAQSGYYENKKTFKFVLERYYNQRCQYIKEKIDKDLLPDINIFK
ncbi:HipA domain-containing protein [Bathymodiolus thermophilus thioautotrophic gill symbiont]|uniref:HipA-like C-terminal domain-containing protein n=1 Tax=Bathymodiolus thermophilus thioautotrophic gill symbiont TaxID=2360 RepID=A0A1J5TWB7_9GAMM|nr:HipA domain-containing protein [Bathymodiolus thermophilus thioautotrophic gill symbiont]OIR25050.1 hypothetical protein BGC33_05335 [Bathymodiolus thermophilus thioautotrophic gill symbiont]